ncbi:MULTISPECIES: DMT family transporter [Bacillus]|uniref:DMT family transporter n=1 Tax=Bacillus TaxID=1386 RepID=UPI00132EB11E|nr:DMT family transporter [Bacillus paranthracis]MCC2409698.1 DMT family transporter [Bacillus paranthracis]NOP80115.1 DMT family transporter [Bacillus paranthracis]QHH85559.1 DMT family transporter [Bacillus paranthracis]
MKQTILGAICLSLAASIWGGMYVVSKYVLNFIPPLTLVWLRFIIAFVVLYMILKITEKKQKKTVTIRKKDWLLFAWIGFIGYFISITCQFIGTKLSDAHTGSLVTSATPAFMVIFAAIILKEKLTARRLLSTIIATIGVIIVIGWDIEIGSYFIGTIILVGAAITWALLSIYVKIASARFSSLVITTYAIFFSLFFITPFMIWEFQSNPIEHMNLYVVLGVLYLGIVSTAGAFFLWNKGLELMDASIGSLFFFFQPIVGSLLGWLLLNETLNSNFFIGGILIICSVFITTFERK